MLMNQFPAICAQTEILPAAHHQLLPLYKQSDQYAHVLLPLCYALLGQAGMQLLTFATKQNPDHTALPLPLKSCNNTFIYTSHNQKFSFWFVSGYKEITELINQQVTDA